MTDWLSLKELCEKYPGLVYENVRSAIARQRRKGNKTLSKKDGKTVLVNEHSFLENVLGGTMSFASLTRQDLEDMLGTVTRSDIAQDVVGGVQDAWVSLEDLSGDPPVGVPKRRRRKRWTFISLVLGGLIAGFLKKYFL